MQFSAKARYVRCSPYKLRPLVSAIRGKAVEQALNVLATVPLKKSVPVKKLIESAASNAKCLKNIESNALVIKDIRVDQGPVFRYYKPGAMGRSSIQRRRLCHMSVMLEVIEGKEE